MKTHTTHSTLWIAVALVCAVVTVIPEAVYASDVSVTGVQSVANSITGFLQGPIAKSGLILALLLCGAMFIISRSQNAGQNLGRIAIGGCLILFAAPLFGLVFKTPAAII